MQPVQYTCYSKNTIDNFDSTPKVPENNLKTANLLLSEVKAQSENTQTKIKLLSEALVAAEHDASWSIWSLFSFLNNENTYTVLLVIILLLVIVIF
jgi:hypothetical protein